MEKGTIFITCYTYDPPVCMLSIDQEFMVLLQLIVILSKGVFNGL